MEPKQQSLSGQSMRRMPRSMLAAIAMAAILGLVGACGSEKTGAKDSPTTMASNSTDAAGTIPLSENASPKKPPMWAFPVSVDGWNSTTMDKNGVNQLAKEGAVTTFTSYQLKQGTTGGADEKNSKAYLNDFAAKLASNSQVSKVSKPAYLSTSIPSDSGEDIEFVQQDLTYTTSDGKTYRSRFIARSLDTNVLAVQYAGTKAEWAQVEWETLIEAGLKVVMTS